MRDVPDLDTDLPRTAVAQRDQFLPPVPDTSSLSGNISSHPQQIYKLEKNGVGN